MNTEPLAPRSGKMAELKSISALSHIVALLVCAI
ncbi:unnamed protein product, partial [Heterotrigona itama]